MYYPYFFSNKFEMETVFKLKRESDAKLVMPIIELYKAGNDTIKTLAKIIVSEMPIILILNPYFKRTKDEDQSEVEEFINSFKKNISKQVVYGIYLDSEAEEIYHEVVANDSEREIALFHRDINLNIPKWIKELSNLKNIKYNFFYGEATKQEYHLLFNYGKKIILHDPFKKQETNTLYKAHQDEFFCDIHNNYVHLGFDGFGDYLTIGTPPNDSERGSQPKTVILHYTYPYGIDNENIRIRRFYGDFHKERNTIKDAILIAMKEASNFITNQTSKTCSICAECNDLVKLSKRNNSYSTLGELKKFSMLHHTYMMIKLIN